jgi:PAS domain S-box-containing protein
MSEGTANRPRILIVEDELLVAEDMRRHLTDLGYDVVGIGESAEQAVLLAEQSHPDLVLLDIRLKGRMDGIVAGEEIRRRWQIPIVYLTASTNDDTLARAKATGPYGYLTKPFRPEGLNATILVALHQHRLSRELFMERTWLTTVLGSLSDGVIATDAEGRVRYLNAAAQALIGLEHAVAVGKPIEEVYHLTSLTGDPVPECQLRKALATASLVSKERFVLNQPGGKTVPIEDSAGPIVENGSLIGAVSVFLDISARLRREQEQMNERERLEDEVLQTAQALGQTRVELRALSAHLMTAQEEERRRVARELHDDLGQLSSIIDIEANSLEQQLTLSSAAKASMTRLRTHIQELSDRLREVSHRLHPSIIEDLGLPTALQSLVEEYRQQQLEVALIVRNPPTHLPVELATALYRIAQEALRNAVKHAREAPVRISLLGSADEVQLHVEDAGPGFTLRDARASEGLGLLSMQERARLAGGTLLVRTQPGEGTLIQVRIPTGTLNAEEKQLKPNQKRPMPSI